MQTKQRTLLSYKTDDDFRVDALLITPDFESEEQLHSTPIIINVHGVLGNFLARGTPKILPPAMMDKGYSTLSINTRMGFFGQIFGEGIFTETIMDIEESVRILKSEGFRNIYILGYSLGANLAVYYSYMNPDSGIKGLILEGCSYSLPESQKKRLDRWDSVPKYDDIYKRAKMILGSDPDNKKKDQVFIVYRAWGPSFNPGDIEMFTYRTWWHMRGPEAKYAKTCDLISCIKLPILFLHGQNDNIVDPSEPKALLELLIDAGNEAEYVTIPDAKHDCMENPDAMIEAIVDWLQRQS